VREDTNTIKKKAEALLDASKVVGLEVNTEKNKYTVAFHHRDVGQNYKILIANKSF
jgi:hypothetical protein